MGPSDWCLDEKRKFGTEPQRSHAHREGGQGTMEAGMAVVTHLWAEDHQGSPGITRGRQERPKAGRDRKGGFPEPSEGTRLFNTLISDFQLPEL